MPTPKERRKKETIILGLNWLSFSLQLKLLHIVALQFLDLKSRFGKVKLKGIKLALDGGINLCLRESGFIKGSRMENFPLKC